MMPWELLYSWRILQGRRKSFFSPMTLIAICGIAFGMTAMLVSISVISGFQRVYEEAILGFNAHVVLIEDGEIDGLESLKPVLDHFRVSPSEIQYWKQHKGVWSWLGRLPGFKDPRMEALSQKGIVAATPFIYREGLGIFPDEVRSVVLKGVETSQIQNMYPLHFRSLQEQEEERLHPHATPAASHFNPQTALDAPTTTYPSVIIGKILYDSFFPEGTQGQPQIKLMIPKGEGTGKSLKDYAQTFQVVGVFESGLYEFDSQFVMTSIPAMEKLFNLKDHYSGLEIVLDDRSKAPAMARLIEKELPSSFQAISWDELNGSLFSAMKMEKVLFLIIMSLIMLVASFNVMGIILMLILQRERDIAIFKVMGARRQSLNLAFAVQGLFLATVGILLGSALSGFILWTLDRFKWFALDPKIYFISHLPVDWSTEVWLGLITAALLICYGVSRIASGWILRKGSLTQTFR